MNRFNGMAFDMLMAELGISTYKEFVQFMGSIGIVISENGFREWRINGVVPVGILQLLCNTVHFPYSLFVTVDGITDDREYRIVDAGKWKDVYLRPKAMIDATRDRSTYIERVKEMGMGRSYKALRADDEEQFKKMSCRRLIEMANNSNVYLGDVIIDDNLPFLVGPGVKPANTESAERMLRSEQARNVAMERRDEELQELVELLRGENEVLQCALNECYDTVEAMGEELKNKNVTMATLRNNCLGLMRKCQDLEKELKAEKNKCRKRERYDNRKGKPEK